MPASMASKVIVRSEMTDKLLQQMQMFGPVQIDISQRQKNEEEDEDEEYYEDDEDEMIEEEEMDGEGSSSQDQVAVQIGHLSDSSNESLGKDQ